MGAPTATDLEHVALYAAYGHRDTSDPAREAQRLAEGLQLLTEVADRLFTAAGVRLVSFQDARLERDLRAGSPGPWSEAVANFLRGWDRSRARLWLPDLGYSLPEWLAGAAAPFREHPRKGERALILYLGYGGKEDILRAARRLADRRGEGPPSAADFEAGLVTAGLPDPDLVILTGTHPVLPDFLLYQISYSEFYLAGVGWERFTLRDLDAALKSFRGRERRYGRLT